ncbi:MAG: amino acid permease [Actinobacteria bacterium]|nr:amino acid permease [Actinomycetota bacterium]
MQNNPEPDFKKSLNLLDSTSIVVGSMIGSGIFIVSADMLKTLGSPGWLLVAWVLTGVLTIFAAVSYGELSGMFPKAGGQYVYLKESYNPLAGFLYGWSFFSVIQTGTIAAVAVGFAKFAGYFFPALAWEDINTFSVSGLKIHYAQLVAIVLIIFLTFINTRGIKTGKIIQTIFTSTKLLSLFGLIIAGFIAFNWDVWNANWKDPWIIKELTKSTDGSIGLSLLTGVVAIGAIASAMVGSIFSSDAWNNVTFIAGEIKNPKRNIGLSLFLGTVIVTIIYLLMNVVYLATVPLNDLAFAKDNRVALSASEAIFGGSGTIIIALMIMVSTFGCNNGLILAGARVYYTMAKDKLFFRQAGTLNKNAVPAWALWIQCLVASGLCLSGKYGDLLDMVSFVVVIFYVLTIAGIFILRKKQPDAERPYKTFGYPVLPIIYIVMGISFCSLLIIYKPQFTWPGLIIVLIGIPIYFIWKGLSIKQNS